MPWVPKTDFEEEVVNLQPDHDFIYGTLSEPNYTYPRPQSHIEYAVNKKMEKKNQDQKTSPKIRGNAKLRAIEQVQRMANTKPLGEQPTVDDWDNNSKIEQETVGMLRYHGLSASVEQPFDKKVTIATFPVENEIKVIKTGRRKVAYFFDDSVFHLKQKVTDSSSSGTESCNTKANDFSAANNRNLIDLSLNSSTSLSSASFSTCDSSDATNSFNPAIDPKQLVNLNAERLKQYEKLLEETYSLSLSCDTSTTTSNSSVATTTTTDSFKSTKENKQTTWTPIPEGDEHYVGNILNNCEHWPDLFKTANSDACNFSTCSSHSSHYKADQNDSLNMAFNDVNTNVTTSNGIPISCSSSSTNNNDKRINFLERFIKDDNLDKTFSIPSKKPTVCEPKTYASIAKEAKQPKKSSKKVKDIVLYTPREVYALRRKAKNGNKRIEILD